MTDTKATPTPKQIDALIDEYSKFAKIAAEATIAAKARTAEADGVKTRLVAMVEEWGVRHAEKSKRLKGLRNTATTTTATKMTVDPTAGERFREYLGTTEVPDLSKQFFTEQTTYQLVATPHDVLKKLSVGARIRNKMVSLLAVCFEMKTSAPSLKIDVGADA